MITLCCFFFNDTGTTEIYTYCHTLSQRDALPIYVVAGLRRELVVDVGVPEAKAVAVFMDAQRPSLTAVVGGQGHFDAVVELAQAFVEIGGGGHGGGVRVVAGSEAGDVRPTAEALAGGVHALHGPCGAGPRGGGGLAVGPLGHA